MNFGLVNLGPARLPQVRRTSWPLGTFSREQSVTWPAGLRLFPDSQPRPIPLPSG